MIELTVPMLLQVIEWGLTLVGAAFSAFKAYQWVKDMRDKDLAELKSGVQELRETLVDVKSEIASQTRSIVTELQEQREYMKVLYGPVITRLMQGSPAAAKARAKRSPRPTAKSLKAKAKSKK